MLNRWRARGGRPTPQIWSSGGRPARSWAGALLQIVWLAAEDGEDGPESGDSRLCHLLSALWSMCLQSLMQRADDTHPEDVQTFFIWGPEVRGALDGEVEVESSTGWIVVCN